MSEQSTTIMVDVFVTGIPRSGNTYLSRLIGDALDSPVGGARGAVALATEGQDRPGQHRVMQLHLLPNTAISERGEMKEKACRLCGKRPATGIFRVLCDKCREKMRKKVGKDKK
jgi:hypothetical protein